MATVLGCNLRLTDVHATAETVGREFKELTDKFGMECIKRLVPPVLEALERLEVYVEGYQHLQTRLSRLQMDNDTVEYERAQRTKLAEENEVIATRSTHCGGYSTYYLVVLVSCRIIILHDNLCILYTNNFMQQTFTFSARFQHYKKIVVTIASVCN